MFKKFLLDIFFPQFCLNCGREGEIICRDCLSLIDVLQFQYCPFCQKPKRVLGRGKCPHHRQMKLDGLFAATLYQDRLVKLLIKNFKYPPYLKSLARPLSSLIIAHFLLLEKEKFLQKENSSILAVPLFGRKKRKRGFNQSELIAKELSDFFKVPLLTNNLTKPKKTQPQATLKGKEREENVKGAFKLKNPELVKGKTIFLVDDVFTTGSTLEEASCVLKKAGAKEVWGVVITRETFL